MTQFEFFIVIAGVVIGIAMAEIVSGWGRLVRTNTPVKLDWLQFGWTVAILLNAMLYWIGIWPYADSKFQTLWQVYFLVIPTLFLVLIAFAITPTEFSGNPFSVREYYISRRKPIFIFQALFQATSTAADFIVGDRQMSIMEVLALALSLAVFLGLAYTERIWLHGIAMAFSLLSMVLIGFSTIENVFERFNLQ